MTYLGVFLTYGTGSRVQHVRTVAHWRGIVQSMRLPCIPVTVFVLDI